MDQSCPVAYHPTCRKHEVSPIPSEAKKCAQNQGALYLLYWKGITAPMGYPSQTNPRDTGRACQALEGPQ
jgi:hypothetical protein